MRIAIGVLAAAVVGLSASQTAEETKDLVALFTTLENTFARGYQEKDIPLLEGLLAPEYALTVSARPDAPYSRAEWLSMIPNYNVRRFEIRGVQVRCLQQAPDCTLAAVSSINTQQADVGGQDRSGEFFIIDIWARRNGRWLVVSRYSGRTEAALPKLMERE